MKKTAFISTALFFVPFIAFAQSLTPISNLIGSINRIVGTLVPLLMAVALVIFFYGLVKYIWDTSSKGHAHGVGIMRAGIVSLFVMASVWGIIALAQSALGIPTNVAPTVPLVPHS